MRSWLRCASIVLVLAAVAGPAGAGVETSTHIRRYVSLWFNDWDPMGNRSRDGQLVVEVLEGATSSGTGGAPSTSYRAAASTYECDFNMSVCTGATFNWQTINLTGLSMDPLGNSATIDVCLLPSSGGNCVDFDLTLTRPSGLNPGFLCFPALLCGFNAWWDPDGNAVHAGLNSQPGITRYGYEVSGTFAGQPWQPPVGGFLDSQGWVQLLANEQIDLP